MIYGNIRGDRLRRLKPFANVTIVQHWIIYCIVQVGINHVRTLRDLSTRTSVNMNIS